MASGSDSMFLTTEEKSPTLYYHKICLAGDIGVGKSTLFMRLKTDRFVNACHSTLTLDAHKHIHVVDGIEVPMLVNDTCGYEKIGTFSPNYFKGALAVILMFSVEELSTLYQLQSQIEEAKTYAHSMCFFILVGNKTDLLMEVDKAKVLQFNESLNCENIVYISAKNGENVEQLMNVLSRSILKICEQGDILNNKIQLSANFKIRKTERKKAFKC